MKKLLVWTLVLAPLFSEYAAYAADRPVEYSRDIRPILSDLCYKCHGPDEAERKSGLRLDTPAGAVAKLESGFVAIVPGKSGESELMNRILSTDPAEQMPPPATGKTLTKTQIELIRRWIDEGAAMRGHWAFISPVRPEPPAVKHAAQVRNPIDQFILQRLEQEGLAPSPEADRVTLIRRVTYDLTGLPPTPAEVDAFLADTSDNAYEKLVDRLLGTTRYGEHQARYWLDAARYGDSHGLHFDNERSMWLYRDWVISAFNRNLPFDQFTIEQLAGDLLPDPTVDQKIATGFNRCNVSTSEGGSIDDEVLVRYTVDRVETTATVWMGLTLGCSVCHDHKYDPFTQKEFYQLYAYFNSIAERAMDGNAKGPPPIMKVPTPEQTAALQAVEEQLAAARKKVSDEVARVEYIEPPASNGANPAEAQEFVWVDDELPSGAKPEGNTPWEFVSKVDRPVYSGEKASTRTAEGLSQHFFTGATPGVRVGEGDRLFAYVYLEPTRVPKAVMLQWNDGNWEHRAVWGEDIIPFGTSNTPGRLRIGPLPDAGQWVRLEVECAKVGLQPGAVLNGLAFTQHDGTVHWDKAGIVTRTPQGDKGFDSILAWEAFEKAQSKSKIPAPVLEAIKVETDKRTPEQQKLIRDYFVEKVWSKTRPVFEPLLQPVAELEKKRADLDGAIPITMVSAEMPERRDAYFLIRGQYDKKGDKVLPGVPAALPPLPKDATPDRLGFARWLVDPAHPLTARVAVNRMWQQLFGTGIVKTAEDFGSQGQWPTHPELLDWLALEFMQGRIQDENARIEDGGSKIEKNPAGAPSSILDPRSSDSAGATPPGPPFVRGGGGAWDVKHILKLMVMSGAYRQAAKVSPELAQRDPENLLLARGPRFRLDAEVIRDSALAMSGLLIERVGGKSVKPYQPEGLWEAISFQGSNTQNFKRDDGDGLYRRSLYTFWKRTSPPPSLLTFDAPSRETCTVRRARTNTPLQALVLLNDTQYVEAARELAERLMTQTGKTLGERATLAFRLATARLPTADELAVLLSVYQKELAEFQTDREGALKLLATGEAKRNESLDPAELAAWTMVANLVLNLDEAVTKE